MYMGLGSAICALGFALVTSGARADGSHEPIGEAAWNLPIFDAHVHYKEPAWGAFPVERIISLMDQNGVAMGLVSSTPDDGTVQLWEFAPNRIVPEVRPYHGSSGSSNWTETPGIAGYIEERLETYPHEGIGEFHIRSRAMWNEDLFRDIIEMAKDRDLYLHVHAGTDPIRWLYEVDPEVKIIWAHAGLGEPASAVYSFLAEFPNLLADTSLRQHNMLGFSDELDPEWRKIIFDFQDRLMLGSDTWVNSQWDRYNSIIDSNRAVLAKLPRDVAEKLAYKNAERYFNRSISLDLIGTK